MARAILFRVVFCTAYDGKRDVIVPDSRPIGALEQTALTSKASHGRIHLIRRMSTKCDGDQGNEPHKNNYKNDHSLPFNLPASARTRLQNKGTRGRECARGFTVWICGA